MRKTYLFAAALAAAATAAFILTPGCEPAEGSRIVVTPSYAELRASNPEVRLTASGWSEYEWELSNYEIGRLSSTTGESVIYSINGEITKDITQTVTVKGRNISAGSSNTGGGGNNSGTNSNSNASSAGSIKNGKALIQHIAKIEPEPEPEPITPVVDRTIKIFPPSADLLSSPSASSSITLTATAGWEFYRWTLQNPGIGNLDNNLKTVEGGKKSSVKYTAVQFWPTYNQTIHLYVEKKGVNGVLISETTSVIITQKD